MSAAPSQTRMCNGALVHLGTARRIESISQGTPIAAAFRAVWDEAVRQMQAAHPWNPCLQRHSCPASATETPVGSQWSTAFELPPKLLRWLPWAPGEADFFDGELEGQFILSNASAPIVVRGIFLIEDVQLWTPGMEQAMASKLAALTAKAITGQSGMIDRMHALFEADIAEAKKLDGLATGQRHRRASFRSSWLDARSNWNTGR